MDVFADYAIIHEMLSCGDESNLLDRLLSDKDNSNWALGCKLPCDH